MGNVRVTEAQKMRKYNLAAEVKRKYEELQRVKEMSDESAEKIKSNRNFSDEYIEKCVADIRNRQKEAQKRIYDSVCETIRNLEQAVETERPSEVFDFGSQKFTNALKLIETGGKNLPEPAQQMIASQFRYCPDALEVLLPLMTAAGMQYGSAAINQLRNEALSENNYPDSLEDAFYFECRRTDTKCADLADRIARIDTYVHSSDVFNAAPGIADELTNKGKVEAAAHEISYAAQLRANEIVAAKLADMQQ